MTEERKIYHELKSDTKFYIEETRFGLWTSFLLDGTGLVTSGTKEACLEITPWHVYWAKFGYDGDAHQHETSDYQL